MPVRQMLRDILNTPALALESARGDKSAAGRAWYCVVKTFIFFRIFASEFRRNHCTSRASGIAFVLLITLIPLIATGAIFFAGITDVSTEQVEHVVSAFLPFVPPAVMDYIITFFKNAQSLRGIGIGVLVVLTLGLFAIIEQALNSIWQARRARSFFARLRSFTMVVVYGPVLFFAAYYLRGSGIFGVLPQDNFLMRVPPVILTALAFAVFYWFIPNTPVRVTSALLGGVVACALFELERWGFGYYVNFSIQTHTIYGGFGLIVFFLLSLYFTALLFLLGAQTAYIHQSFRPLLRVAQRRDRRVGDYRDYVTIRILIDCVRSFMRNTPPPTRDQICETYDLSVPQATGILNWLVHENFIYESDGGKRRKIYIPARDFTNESVSAIFSSIEEQHRRIPVTPNDSAKEYLAEFMIEYAKRKIEHDLTLGELIGMVDKHENCEA